MWIVTTQGHYSIVQHREDPTRLLVRARNKADIDRLIANYLPEAKPWEDQWADYAWRIEVSAADWAQAMAKMALDIDYDNFKNAASKALPDRTKVLYDVHADLMQIEDDRPGKRSKSARNSGKWKTNKLSSYTLAGLFSDEVQRVIELVKDGHTNAEIAEELGHGVTEQMVGNALAELQRRADAKKSQPKTKAKSKSKRRGKNRRAGERTRPKAGAK